MRLLLVLVSVFIFQLASAQNPYKYESKVIVLNWVGGGNAHFIASPGGFNMQGVYGQGNNFTRNSHNLLPEVLQTVMNFMNNKGFSCKLVSETTLDSRNKTFTLLFEKSTSYREENLQKMINEITTRIDVSSKKYVDSAMNLINTNVLNYLQSIPNDVITQAYKDELTRRILLDAEDKIKKAIEEAIKQVRASSVNNPNGN